MDNQDLIKKAVYKVLLDDPKLREALERKFNKKFDLDKIRAGVSNA